MHDSWWNGLTLLLAACASVVGAAAWLHPEVDGSDLWWHMAAGRWVVQNGAIPLQDMLTHTAVGQPWADHEWLWGVLAFQLYELHPAAVAWLNLAVASSVFGLVAWRAFDLSGSWPAACLVTWFAAAASHWYIDVRPHLFTLLFTALLLATFRLRWAPWLWPPLLALWVNLHGGFIFGVGLVGLWVLLESLRAMQAGDPLPLRSWLFVALTVFAAGLNPWGLAMYLEPFEHLREDTPFSQLLEWLPLEWSIDPGSYAGRFFWLGLLALAGFWRGRRDPYALLLVVLTAVMTMRARRFVPLFAVVAAPVAALAIAGVLERMAARLRLPSWAAAVGAGVALALAISMWSGVRFTPRPLARWTLLEAAPSGAVDYLARMSDPPERLFNTYHWGGYVSFFAPRVRTFIDGRAATLYSDELVADYHTLVAAGEGWRELMRKYAIDAVLVQNPSPLARALVQSRPPWQRLGADPRSLLLFSPERGATPPLGPVIGDTADLHLARAFAARTRREYDVAAREVDEVLKRDPLQLYAHAEGMMLAAERDDASGVQQWIERALEVYPRRRDLISTFAERAWRAMGERELRREALASLRLGGPFVTSETREGIAKLLASLDEPPEAAESVPSGP